MLDVKSKPAKESGVPKPSQKAAEPRAAGAAVEHIAFQLVNPPSTPTKEEDGANAAANAAVSDRSSYGIIIEDDLPVGEGQVHRTEFMDHLAPLIESTAEQILSPAGRAARDCPYLAFWINYYRQQSAAHIEHAIALYARPQRTDREGIEQAILDHVRQAVQVWVDRREVQVPGSIDWRVDDDHVPDKPGDGAVAQRMGADGHGSPAAPGSAAAIRGQLSAGRPLEPSVRTRMERGFGTNFSDVRLHDDANAASLARTYQARAFTVGQDVAFSAGQYRPGSLSGDLLLAHELAHTLQQRGAGVEGPAAEGLEADATLSAVGAILPDTRLDPRPSKRGGLGLRRCGTGQEPAPPTVSEQEYQKTMSELREQYRRQKAIDDGEAPASERADVDRRIAGLSEKIRGWGVQISDSQLKRAAEDEEEDLRARIGEPGELEPEDGYSLVKPPGLHTVGRTYELQVRGPERWFSDGSRSNLYGGNWYVKKPGDTKLHGLQGWTGSSHAWTLDVPGQWEFAVAVRLQGGEHGVLYDSITVRQPTDVAAERLDKVGKTDLAGYLASLEYQNLMRIHLGVVDQQFGIGTAYISLNGTNPVDKGGGNPPANQYTAHPPAGVTATRYEWVAVPDDLSKYPTQSYFGRTRGVVGGMEGFNLGTNETTSWEVVNSGIVDIYCIMYDSVGQVAKARYRQVILTTSEGKEVSKFQSYMKDARTELKKITEKSAVFVPAFHVATATGITTELSLFTGIAASGSDTKIIDITPAVPRRDYGGANFSAALSDFSKGNSYPDGLIRLRIPANDLGIKTGDWNVPTSGASVTERLSSIAGWESLGLAGLGVLAAIVPGAEPLAPAFFLAAAGTGAVSAGAGLYQQSLEAHPSGIGIAINIASLAGSLLGLAGAANVLRYGPRVAALTKVGRFVLYAGFTTDAIGGVFIAVEGAEQIAEILDGNGSADAKASAITRILAGLLLNGTMLAWGAHDLAKTTQQVRGVVGPDIGSKLSTSEMHMLSVLEGPSLSRLAGSSLEEVQAVAALVREDPARATALVQRYGEQFVVGARSHPGSLEELAQALRAGAPEAAGTRGSYGPSTSAGQRPAYLEVIPPKGQRGPSSPSGLSDRVLQVFTKPKSTARIELAEGATLRPVTGTPSTGPQTRFELVVPASGSRQEMVIPVKIQSTENRPTSVHGLDTGPARMEIRSTTGASGSTNYEASIEIHENLAKEDIGFAVGHELDELALIATSGVKGTDITAQKRASLLRAQAVAGGAKAPTPTAHDTAQARDFANVVNQRSPSGGRAIGFEMPDDLITRAVEMGFGNSAFLEDKLSFLRTAGVDSDMLERLRTMALRSEASAALPSSSPLATSKLIGHLLHEEGGSKVSPVGGLHLDSALQAHQAELVAGNQPTHLLQTADSPRTLGGVTYNAYEQWAWKGKGSPGPRPTTPGSAAGTNLGGWELAGDPKTTFNSLVPFLTESQAAWDAWRTANPTASGPNVQWQSAAGPGGQTIGGFVDLSGPTVDMRTVYPVRTGGLTSW